MRAAACRLHGLSAGRRSYPAAGNRPCRLWHRRALRAGAASRLTPRCPPAQVRFQSASDGRRRFPQLRRPPAPASRRRLLRCDDAGSGDRDADGCAANGRRARAGRDSKAGACRFGGPRGGSGRHPCARRTVAPRAARPRRYRRSRSAFDGAYAGPVPIPCRPLAAVPAGPVAYAPVVAPLDYTLQFRRSASCRRVRSGRTDQRLFGRRRRVIDVPLIGQVMARGATTEELAHRIAAKLRNGFIREPHVAVEVVAYRPFFILGEVTAPGQYPYVPRMTAETAVAIAGGYTPRGFRRNLTSIARSPAVSCACRCRRASRSGRATPSTCKSAGSDREFRGGASNARAGLA